MSTMDMHGLKLVGLRDAFEMRASSESNQRRPNGPGRRVTFSAWMGLVRAPLDADVDLKTFDGDAAVTEVKSSAGGRHLRLR